jgi:hypothetical protein
MLDDCAEHARAVHSPRKGEAPLFAADVERWISERMQRSPVFGALLWPVSASAHGSAAVFYLLWWHIALIFCMLGFLIFSSVGKRRKLCSILGFVLVPIVVWSVLGNVSPDRNAWQDMAFYVAVGVAPMIGFVGGLYLTRSKGRTT